MKKYILDQETIARKLERIAYEIVENNLYEPELILVGIKENGSVIARVIMNLVRSIHPFEITLIDLDLDKRNPGAISLSSTPEMEGKVIILIDDVANSGKTMLYALKPLMDAYPAKIQTLALVERSHKAFPVSTDYVGISLATTLQNHIFVEVTNDMVTGAYIE